MCRRGLQKPVNFATVVTDLTTCHNTWFHPAVDRCFVPTEFARNRALKMGLKPHQLTRHGLPIRPAFSASQQPKSKLRKQLGMQQGKPAVLLVGELQSACSRWTRCKDCAMPGAEIRRCWRLQAVGRAWGLLRRRWRRWQPPWDRNASL